MSRDFFVYDVVELDTKGLKILSRKSYEEAAVSCFDNPLSSRYDENDALIYFDDVKVPWERIFVAGDTEMCLKQFHATPAHVYQNYQAQIRLMVKLRFLAGIAHRIATLNGIINFPQVKETLGQLAANVGLVEGLVAAMEAKGQYAGRYFVPDRHTLYTAQVLTQRLYPEIVTTLRDLAGGAMIALPGSAADFAHPELRSLIDRTQQSPTANAYDKVKFYKLAWDALGSEYGSRHTQYEMFYAGATFVTKGHSFRCYDWQKATDLLDHMLGTYDLESEDQSVALRGSARRLEADITGRSRANPMTIKKPHIEFKHLDLESGWETPPGYPNGIEQKILAGELDEGGKRGTRTRLLRFQPGVYTTEPFVHEYWEEVYLLSGDLIVGNDAGGQGGEAFEPNTYACRPPGAYHGPFKSATGCLLLEVHYYDEASS